jgi:glucose-6-phosphate-specific signal transduction histidine kinase
MKRYLIFAALGPFVGGFLLLLVTTTLSGYWTQTDLSEVAKLFVVFVKSLQFSYLFGILPVLIFAALDDIFSHVRWMKAWQRMLVVGAIAFLAAGILYGGKGADSGAVQFILYGLVGLLPAMLCSRLAQDGPEKGIAAP